MPASAVSRVAISMKRGAASSPTASPCGPTMPAIRCVVSPNPQPRSSTRSPGWGGSARSAASPCRPSPSTSRWRKATKRSKRGPSQASIASALAVGTGLGVPEDMDVDLTRSMLYRRGPPGADLPRRLRVEARGLPGDVLPVEGQDVLARLGHEAVAKILVGQHLGHPPAERARVLRAEAQPHVEVRDDLPQAAGVGDDARAARGHRLERDEPERLVDRWHDGEVGDPVERVQDVVADPAHEGAVVLEAELLRLGLELRLRGARA